MKNLLVVVLCTFALVGCKAESEETTRKYDLPSELSDCKIYRIKSDQGDVMNVIRCPNSSTTTSYTQNKSTRSVTVVEQ